MRFLKPLALWGLFFFIVIGGFPFLVAVVWADDTNYHCPTTTEIMADKLASLPEESRVFCELQIPSRPVLWEVRKFQGFTNWTIKEDLNLTGKSPELVPCFKTIEASCVGIVPGEAYIFVEVGIEDKIGVRKILSSFPRIKRDNIKLLGPPVFDADQDPAVYIVISKSIFPRNVKHLVSRVYIYNLDITFPGSSRSEVIFIRAGVSLKKDDLKTFLSHEFNHLLVLSFDFYDDIWVYEGLGYLSAYLIGHGPSELKTVYLDAFLNWHRNALVPEWNMYNHMSAYQFFKFLYKKYGLETIRKIAHDPCDGKESISKSVGKSWEQIWLEYLRFSKEEGMPVDISP